MEIIATPSHSGRMDSDMPSCRRMGSLGSELSFSLPKTPAPKEASGERAMVTPAPQRPAGEVAIGRWIEMAGLQHVLGLQDALLGEVDDLSQLQALTDVQLTLILAPLRLRGLTLKKILAAVSTLRGEAAAFVPRSMVSEAAIDHRMPAHQRRAGAHAMGDHRGSSFAISATAAAGTAMPPPVRPRLSEFRPAPNPLRFRPRTMSELAHVSSLPVEAENAAQARREAKELGDVRAHRHMPMHTQRSFHAYA